VGLDSAQREALSSIEVHGLTKRFRRLRTYRDLATYAWRRRDIVALDDLTFDVREGELFGLLGENGAGKTTAIRVLATTLLPTSGVARVGGFDVVHETTRVREIIGLVTSEERSFYWRLSGRQNLEFFAALYHLPQAAAKRRISELLEAIGIEDVADDRFHTYSTGTRHKFALVRGLLTEPRVLFLDEPTRSLDPIAAADVRRLVNDRIVREMGRTVLLATHSLAEAEAMCGRLAIVRQGSVVATGSVDELRRQFHLATQVELRVRAASGSLFSELARLPGVDRVASDDMDGATVLLEITTQDGTLDRVLRYVLDAGAIVQACETREPTLEAIYRRALGADTTAPRQP
jgi:ABC-2 type transport system ATP-binding protein